MDLRTSMRRKCLLKICQDLSYQKQRHQWPKKAKVKKHHALPMVILKNVKVCHAKMITTVLADAALQQWLTEVPRVTLSSRVTSAQELSLLKSITLYTKNMQLTLASIKIHLRMLVLKNLIIPMTSPSIEAKEDAMCMALIINAMDSHAMTMMTALVGAVDTLYPSSLSDAFHLLRMNSVQDSSSQHIDLQFHRNFLLLNQQFKTCTTSKIESTTLRLMEMEMQ